MWTLLTPRDPAYPALLAVVPAPPDLYVRGRADADDALAIAIVGARRATPYGLEVAERLAGELAARGVTIVSGLARGIDTAAHRGALGAGGRTLAVLGCGIDVVYPPENRALVQEIERRGAVLSQFPPGAPPLAGHFPARNRTLAGLALGVVVVEAGDRSGALISAGYAADLGREVFAVPGRITSETSRGPHRLIQEGAKLVRDWIDVVQELPDQWRRAVRVSATPQSPAVRPAAESEEGRVLGLLSPDEARHIDALIAPGGGTPARTAAALVALELQGLARQLEGQRWVAVGARSGRA
ncbi:MAG: DNA-protecting protein DprA [Candidatus Rokubacteria bacterium]|nr:DNA-protecting protein DprA [Candidatus Rokubacteria bacterium]